MARSVVRNQLEEAKKLGDAIRQERRKLGKSQEEFSFDCELHRTYIGSVERGERNISLENIVRVAAVLRLKPSELLKRAGL